MLLDFSTVSSHPSSYPITLIQIMSLWQHAKQGFQTSLLTINTVKRDRGTFRNCPSNANSEFLGLQMCAIQLDVPRTPLRGGVTVESWLNVQAPRCLSLSLNLWGSADPPSRGTSLLPLYQQIYSFCRLPKARDQRGGLGLKWTNWIKFGTSSKLVSSSIPAAIPTTHNHSRIGDEGQSYLWQNMCRARVWLKVGMELLFSQEGNEWLVTTAPTLYILAKSPKRTLKGLFAI